MFWERSDRCPRASALRERRAEGRDQLRQRDEVRHDVVIDQVKNREIRARFKEADEAES
jgi:hypothetical protein